MKRAIAILLVPIAIMLGIQAHADTLTIQWKWPATWIDGVPLTPADMRWANVWCTSPTNPNYEAVASVDAPATSYAMEFHGARTCAVSIVVQHPLSAAEIAAGATSYPEESDRTVPVTYVAQPVPPVPDVTGVVQGPTPMHCLTTTACTLDKPVPINPDARSP